MIEAEQTASKPAVSKKRWRLRQSFSLRTLILLLLFIGSAIGLWMHWVPWERVAILIAPLAKSISFSPEGCLLATTHTSRMHLEHSENEIAAYVWNIAERRLAFTIPGHIDVVRVAAFISSNRIATSSNDGMVRIWDLNGQQISNFGIEAACDRMAIAQNGKFLGVTSIHGCHVFNLETHTLMHFFPSVDKEHFRYIDFTKNSQQVVVAGDQFAKSWNLSDGKEFSSVDLPLETLRGVDQDILFGKDATGAQLLRVNNGDVIARFSGRHATEFALSHDRKQVAILKQMYLGVGSFDSSVGLFDVATQQLIEHFDLDDVAWSVAFSPDDRGLAIGCDHEVSLWTRRRPERWWGLAWLPEFWFTALSALALIWSLWRDRAHRGRNARVTSVH